MIMMIVLIGVVVIITRAIDNGPAARHGLVMTTILCWWWDAMGWMIRVWMSMATILFFCGAMIWLLDVIGTR